MDVEQEEMQFLGIFGIFQETTKLIYTWRRIFAQITLALILPLSFLFLAHMELSNIFIRKIIHDEINLYHTKTTTPKFDKLSDVVSKEKIYYWIFQVSYIILSMILSLLSTSAVVYTVASIYTARDVTFKQVMSVVPKVWKRLLITFLCVFISFIAIGFVAFFTILFVLFIIILIQGPYGLGHGSTMFIFWILLILMMVGFFYLTILWQLANVISVLEDCCGFKAMAKSRALIKGKMVIAIIIPLFIGFPLGTVKYAFGHFVVRTTFLGVGSRGILGIMCFMFLFVLFLLKLVMETVLYFVCKSYHHENIDKSALSDHLEVYLLGEYVPLKAKDVQLEKLQV